MAATVTVRLRPRHYVGPALRRTPLPVGAIVLSAVVHLAAVAALFLAAMLWHTTPPKAYVVNLVPSVPALGVPHGRPAPPTTPPKVLEPPRPAPAPAPPREAPVSKQPPAAKPEPPLPVREAPAPARSAPPPDLPRRSAKAVEMPTRERPREIPSVPDRPAAAREPALPRPGQKELPPIAASLPRPVPPPPAPAAPSREAAAAPAPALPPSPPPPAGRPTGTVQGAGAVLNTGGDFPFTWYLRAVERKVYERWAQPLRAADGQQAVIVFDIGRDGQVSRARIEKTSGDPLYDQAALRAVTEANPFPQLPAEFREPMLRVHFGFSYQSQG